MAIRLGACTVDDVGDACEAGTGCGSCRGGIEVLLDEARRRTERRGSLPEVVAAQLRLFEELGGDDEA